MSEVQASPGPYTWDDFVALDDDDRRELIDGELVEVEVPNGIHEYIVLMLGHYLVSWALPRKAGFGVASGFKVRVSDRRGVMPDVQFFRPTNTAMKGQPVALASGRPDLAVEIISPSSRRYDRMIKLAWYASIGVPEYWILDPTECTLERLVLQGDKYLVAEIVADDATFRPESFEGLEIPLGSLWRFPES